MSGNRLVFHEIISNNNQIEKKTDENSITNNYYNNQNITNNYYLLHSINYNNCCGCQSDNYSNEYFNNNTQKNTLSLLKKKSINHHKLILKNIIGNLFEENLSIIINEYGIENLTPLRRKYDGITKFGPNCNDKDGKPINDYKISISDKLKDKVETLFMIEYNNIKQTYCLVPNYFDENKELNIFIKLENVLPIEQNYNFSLGGAHFRVEPKSGGALELEISMEDGERESYLFGIAKEFVKIGRSKNCDIILKSLAYSRVQTSIYYKKDENIWYIQDGFDNKKSMNGTWLYINFPWDISFNTKLRIGQNLIELNAT